MSARVYVWDKFIRVFHWSLVTLFIVSYLTGENEHWLHIYSGYAIAILICLRLVWGLIGSQHAKFKDFIFSLSTIVDCVKGVASGRSKRYLGHNPLGGLMVIAFLITLLTIVLSGMKLYAVEEGKGPFSLLSNEQVASELTFNKVQYEKDDGKHEDDDELEEADESHRYSESRGKESEEEDFWEDLHELAVNFMLLLIILHVLGVFVSSRLEGESLVKSMVSGYKKK